MSKWILRIYFSGLILAPIVLLILPADFFDHGRSICLSVLLFHRKCFACGTTKAVMHLLHFDFKGAAYYNKLSFVILPVLIYCWVEELTRIGKKIRGVKKTEA